MDNTKKAKIEQDFALISQVLTLKKEKEALLITVNVLKKEATYFNQLHEEHLTKMAILKSVNEKLNVKQSYQEMKKMYEDLKAKNDILLKENIGIQEEFKEFNTLKDTNENLTKTVADLKDELEKLNSQHADIKERFAQHKYEFDQNLEENNMMLLAEFQMKEHSYLQTIENQKLSHSKKMQMLKVQLDKSNNDLKEVLMTNGQLREKILEQQSFCSQIPQDQCNKDDSFEKDTRIAQLKEQLIKYEARIMELEKLNKEFEFATKIEVKIESVELETTPNSPKMPQLLNETTEIENSCSEIDDFASVSQFRKSGLYKRRKNSRNSRENLGKNIEPKLNESERCEPVKSNETVNKPKTGKRKLASDEDLNELITDAFSQQK